MHSRPVEAYVEDRVANLLAISQRRNALLREMYQMICQRIKLGQVLGPDQEDDEGLKVFLQRFSMTQEDFQTGSIRHLNDHEMSPDSSPQYDPPGPHVPEQTRDRQSPSEYSTKHEPASPLGPSKSSNHEYQATDTVAAVSSALPTSTILLPPEDNGDDELDLLRKSLPMEPVNRVATKADSSNTFSMEMDEDDYVPPPKSDTPKKSEAGVSPPLPKPALPSPMDLQEAASSRSTEDLQHRSPSHPSIIDACSRERDLPPSNSQSVFLPVIPSPTKQPTVVFTGRPPTILEPIYAFPDPPPVQTVPAPKEQPQRQHQFHPDFTIPSLKSINCDYKKTKALKRKREKEREAGGKDSRKDDWMPLGLNRWAATLSANPVWKKVARASKCLTTREWAVAMSELRLTRALERIELLKREGRWSFRQPKKQRTIGGMSKTHWDYLIDEMKWMRIDFREERKWKIAMAYSIATDVLDWHAAGTAEMRLTNGISVRWKRPRPEVAEGIAVDQDHPSESDVDHLAMEIDAEEGHPQERTSLLGVDYGSDDDEEDEDNDEDIVESQNVADGLEPSSLIVTALEDADHLNNIQVVQPKTEEVEDLSALIKHDVHDSGASLIDNITDIKPENISGLKTTSNDPVLMSQPTPSSNNGDMETFSSTSSKSGKSNIYAPLREIIAYSKEDQLFLDLEEFNMGKLIAPQKEAPYPPPPGLESIFPDLNILDFDFTPVVQTLDNKKRLDKKIDRDDPNRRPDDVLYTRLYPTGDFMTSKPTLIGPLRPSRNWKNGQWLSLDDSAVGPESDIPKIDDSGSDLFDARTSNGPSLIALQLQTAFLKDKEIRKRNEHLWNNVDDTLLKSLCDKYPNNWALIAECFNASRLTISIDKRTPRDCLDRWREKWGPEMRRMPEHSSAVEVTPPPTSSQMTTRGVKRLASVSISSVSTGGMMVGSEPRKKRRHALVLETIRKAGKKRAEALQKAQSQRKAPGVHETHAQYSKLPKRTPAELSRAKAEKDALQLQEMRKRQEEANRNVMLRLGNGQGPSQQAIPQQVPQAQPQPQNTTVMPRPAGANIPAQVVPQIRNQVNISQQQRANTPAMQPGRLTQQQLIQRVQQQQQHALTHAQNQIQANGVVAVNGTMPGSNPHLSPTYVNRDVALSVSPPHNSAVASAVNSPRPPSAQAQAHPMPIQVPGNPGTRGTYYLPNLSVQGYTSEQLQTALRISREHQQQATQQGFPNQS